MCSRVTGATFFHLKKQLSPFFVPYFFPFLPKSQRKKKTGCMWWRPPLFPSTSPTFFSLFFFLEGGSLPLSQATTKKRRGRGGEGRQQKEEFLPTWLWARDGRGGRQAVGGGGGGGGGRGGEEGERKKEGSFSHALESPGLVPSLLHSRRENLGGEGRAIKKLALLLLLLHFPSFLLLFCRRSQSATLNELSRKKERRRRKNPLLKETAFLKRLKRLSSPSSSFGVCICVSIFGKSRDIHRSSRFKRKTNFIKQLLISNMQRERRGNTVNHETSHFFFAGGWKKGRNFQRRRGRQLGPLHPPPL